MTNKILGVVRMILLLLVMAFIALLGYKYYKMSEFDYGYLVPIAGLLVFYFITKPKAK